VGRDQGRNGLRTALRKETQDRRQVWWLSRDD
jgi:hypothetical protein